VDGGLAAKLRKAPLSNRHFFKVRSLLAEKKKALLVLLFPEDDGVV
jgi:hypothetical protein